jgi:hypothetical protein
MMTRCPVGMTISPSSGLPGLSTSPAEAARFHGRRARGEHRAAVGHVHRCRETIEKPRMSLTSVRDASIACGSTDGGVNRRFAWHRSHRRPTAPGRACALGPFLVYFQFEERAGSRDCGRSDGQDLRGTQVVLMAFSTSSNGVVHLRGDQRGRYSLAEPTGNGASTEGRHRVESVDSRFISPVWMVR